jgi:hypothetical protein
MNRRAFLVIGLLGSTALVPAVPVSARAAHKVSVVDVRKHIG